MKKCVEELERENRYLENVEERVNTLEKEVECLSKCKVSARMIAGDDQMTRFYTGLPTYNAFLAFFSYFQGKASSMWIWRGPKEEELVKTADGRGVGCRKGGRKLSLIDEFFVTLIRLRLGLYTEDIAQCFGIYASYF